MYCSCRVLLALVKLDFCVTILLLCVCKVVICVEVKLPDTTVWVIWVERLEMEEE